MLRLWSGKRAGEPYDLTFCQTLHGERRCAGMITANDHSEQGDA